MSNQDSTDEEIIDVLLPVHDMRREINALRDARDDYAARLKATAESWAHLAQERDALANSLTAWKDRALQAEALMDQSLEARIERLELIVMLLCDKASRGEGSMGKPFWEFAETIKRELVEPLGNDKAAG